MAHHFFRMHVDAYTKDDVGPLLAELDGHRTFIKGTDEAFEDFIAPTMEKLGYTKELRQKLEAEYLRQAPHSAQE